MIVIADSGSSKTDWRVIKSTEDILQLTSMGLNPNFHTVESVFDILKDTFKDSTLNKKVEEIYFYGAGCSIESNNEMLFQVLSQFFTSARVEVHHDLLGACRASCGKKAGLTAILGTGSNCCRYNGEEIVESYPSGGYSIGDEGGGVNIGRRILKAYIEEYLPQNLRERFDFRYKLTLGDILKNLYQKEKPNRFMANFSHFAFQHKENPFISSQLVEEFSSFFDRKVLRYEGANELTLNMVGSVAYYYQELIRSVAEEKGVNVGIAIEKPIAALSLYHTNLGKN